MIDNQETQEKIAAEVRDLSKFVRNKVELGEYIDAPMPTAFGKPLDVYYAELADRIESAARRDYEYPKAQSLDADKLTGKNISGLVTDLRQIAKYHYARGNIEQGQFARVMSDRIEAAQKRERESITPKPDPNWEEICEKCHDGDIEPNCEYYGEPNGCNSPIYGEHPTAGKSSPVGNAATLRKALKNLVDVIDRCDSGSPLWWHSGAKGVMPLKKAKAALAEPPRNCDAFSKEEVLKELEDCSFSKEDTIEWIYSEAKGETDEQK